MGNAVNNEIANVGAAGRDVALAGQCLTDTFTVTSPGGNAPPVICGTNSQQHSNPLNSNYYYIFF